MKKVWLRRLLHWIYGIGAVTLVGGYFIVQTPYFFWLVGFSMGLAAVALVVSWRLDRIKD